MCHHHNPIDLIAERHGETEDDEADADADAEMPTLTPPADD
jgi:hypothetical protein